MTRYDRARQPARKASTRRSTDKQHDTEADLIINAFRAVVTGIHATFGSKCEVILHDYRKQEHSAVAVAGNVTGRKVGSPMSQIGLSLMRQGEEAEDKLNYLVRLPDGRQLKSSTMLLRTRGGSVGGALCVNIEVTELRTVGLLLSEMAGDLDTSNNDIATFGNDIESVINTALTDVERHLGRPLTRLSTKEWTEVFRFLDQRGLFQLKRAVPLLAQRLSLSRASIYNYMGRIRDDAKAQDR